MKETFPQTLLQAVKYFSNPDTALACMVAIRWPDGIFCPRCESKEYSFVKTRRIWICKGCKKHFSVKLGTIMEDSPIGLDKWLSAIWLIVNAKNGISSYEVHRALGITQKSAWFLMHRIRKALQAGTFKKLCGDVEIDETFIGGVAKNMHESKRKHIGTGGAGKVPVLGLLQRNGQISAHVVPDVKAETLRPYIDCHVQQGANVYTDKWVAYRHLKDQYNHGTVNHMERYVDGEIHTNSIENFWSLLKRAIKGTYVSVEPFHLFRYVDEQAFRFNARKGNDSERFIEAAQNITGKRLTLKQLTGKEPAGYETSH
jgi:transposase-like protein